MRRLLPDPDPGEHPVGEAYAGLVLPAPAAGRATHVALGMVSSVDGAASIDGTSGALGGEADGVAFRALRAACDAIVVGAGTVRAEDYGPPTGDEARRRRRAAAGLAPVPRLVVVSGSLSLDPSARILSDPDHPPLLVGTTAARHRDPDRVAALEQRAEVVLLDADRVDPAALLEVCAERGLVRLMVEGGPGLNAQLLAAGVVDELFLTLAPRLAGASEHRIVDGSLPDAPVELTLTSLLEHEGELLLRYGVARPR
ncbi:MAG: dihydrofolate reductase family protein [Actinomycetes bacterium]